MNEELISKLRELMVTEKFEETLNLCNMELSFLDMNNCDKQWLAKIFISKGIALFYLGNKEEALNFLNLAIENNCNCSAAYNNRGYVKEQFGKYKEAILDYDKAIELEPNNVLAYNNRCWAKIILGDYEDAIHDFNTAGEQCSFYTVDYFINTINELLEAGKINIENYNKLIENHKYKTIMKPYDIQMQKEVKELNETIDKCYKNPFLLVKELVLNIALDIVIYPLKRFINKFKKR